MLRDNEERRPTWQMDGARTPAKKSETSIPIAQPASLNLLDLTPEERVAYDTGRLFGYVEGHEAGARWADERAATLHREAVGIVHRLAGLPERDAEADRAAAARREARWSA